MNKKIIIMIISLVILVSICTLILKRNEAKNNKIFIEEQTTTYTDEVFDINISNTNTTINQESNKVSFNKISKLDEVERKITDVKEFGNITYISAENKLYTYDTRGLEEFLVSTKNIKEIVIMGYEAFILKNQDDTYSIYINTAYGEKEYKEVKDIDISNVIYVAYSKIDCELKIFKLHEEGYFVDIIAVDYEANVKSQKIKIPLSIKLNNSGDSRIVRDIKQIYIKDSTDLLIVLKNGEVYSPGITIYSSTQNEYYIHGTDEKILDGVEKIHAVNGYDPIFEKISDKDNLYTYDDYILLNNKKTNEEDIIKIPLTNNYKTADIKNVFSNRSIIIEYTDNTIVQASSYTLNQLIQNDEITKLNKENRIMKIEIYNFKFCILLNDKILYEFNV